MTTVLCFVDTETTGLDPYVHEAYEVSYWREDHAHPITGTLPHTLEDADYEALAIGGYHRRGFTPGFQQAREHLLVAMRQHLMGVTLVGANPTFDAAFLRASMGYAPWHHRLIDVSQGGMWLFDWDRPKGLAAVAEECRRRGYVIPEPDHTAEGDVRTTRAVYYALLDVRSKIS